MAGRITAGQAWWLTPTRIVPGELLVTSSTILLTSFASLVIRVETLASTSYGTLVQSAAKASSDEIGIPGTSHVDLSIFWAKWTFDSVTSS
jgi:hypothetical protein